MKGRPPSLPLAPERSGGPWETDIREKRVDRELEIASPVTRFEYVLAFASFIPVLGLIFGTVAIILGCMKMRSGGSKLVLLGVAGLLFNVLLGFGIHHHMIAALQVGANPLGTSMSASHH